jgi:hypothetical protein
MGENFKFVSAKQLAWMTYIRKYICNLIYQTRRQRKIEKVEMSILIALAFININFPVLPAHISFSLV